MCPEQKMSRFWRPWEDFSTSLHHERTSPRSTEDSPREIRRRRSSLSSNAKQEIMDLHQQFILLGYPDPVKRVSETLKYHRSIIHRVLRDGVRSPTKRGTKKTTFSKIDESQQEVIRRMILRRYGGHEVSSISVLLEQVKEEIPDFPYERTHLYALLKRMGFIFTKNRNKTSSDTPRRR